jgi:hypothetical protein
MAGRTVRARMQGRRGTRHRQVRMDGEMPAEPAWRSRQAAKERNIVVAVYMGYYRPAPGYIEANQARARAEGPSPDPKLQRLVAELPEQLPKSAKIIAAFSPVQSGAVLSDTGAPGVIIIQTDNSADLQFINQHYAGYLMFQWVPANVIGTTRAEREAAMNITAAPTGRR